MLASASLSTGLSSLYTHAAAAVAAAARWSGGFGLFRLLSGCTVLLIIVSLLLPIWIPKSTASPLYGLKKGRVAETE
ncbi:unnamed protein product [Taenia asiatica]|uniref:MFS domain-containing protein n=1 Tax=Taenia asiatica TaxID=60517 RepID=A0A0R3WGJ5_TAEAS|nr:unnamed protein product [Taenia asiatica]